MTPHAEILEHKLPISWPLRIRFRATPESLNKMLRTHWSKRARGRADWYWLLQVGTTPSQRIALKTAAQTQHRMKVRIKTFLRTRRFDPDNLTAAVKPLLDSLVKLQFIRNDSPVWLDLKVEQDLASRNGGISETVIEIEPENPLAGFDHVWFWRNRLPERKGQACRVLVRGGKNSIAVEFPDGFRVITSRFAVRKRKQE